MQLQLGALIGLLAVVGAPCTVTAMYCHGWESHNWQDLQLWWCPTRCHAWEPCAMHGALPWLWALSAVGFTAMGVCYLLVQGEPRILIPGSPCSDNNKTWLDLMLDPKIMPFVMHVHLVLNPIMPLPENLEGNLPRYALRINKIKDIFL